MFKYLLDKEMKRSTDKWKKYIKTKIIEHGPDFFREHNSATFLLHSEAGEKRSTAVNQ
jgi:hypothetical protein